jgi:hypothetical protein
MLDQRFRLVGEMPKRHGRAEIVLVYDEHGMRRADVEAPAALLRGHEPFSVEAVSTPGPKYYQLRNEARGRSCSSPPATSYPRRCGCGATSSRSAIRRSRSSPANTYVDRDTFYAKTFPTATSRVPSCSCGIAARAHVVVSPPLDLSRTHGQQWLVERLDLRPGAPEARPHGPRSGGREPDVAARCRCPVEMSA